MDARDYTEKQLKRIMHIKSHVDNGPDLGAVSNIVNNQGSPKACAMRLSSFARGKAMLAWFEQHDLNAARNWWYLSAKLMNMTYANGPLNTLGPGGRMFELLAPLLSNHEPLIEWYAHHDSNFDMKRVENHKTHDFWAYQGILALRGEWDRLIERCEKVMADPPKDSREQKYLADHEFHLALAHRDMSKMEDVLRQMVRSRNLHARSNDEGGFTEDLISTPAVIYAKIAWRHGCQVRVDSPFVPQEWLPTEPLAQYDNYFSFLN